MTLFEWIQTIASIATAAGVGMAAIQIRLSKQQAATQFEDHLSSQYREIVRRLPIGALLGDSLSQEHSTSLATFYDYFDLTNEQVFLRMKGRLREETWHDWRDGIQTNMDRPAFRTAWEEIRKRSPDTFDELGRLVAEGYRSDPRWWRGTQPALDGNP
jgi:hypothetical protein